MTISVENQLVFDVNVSANGTVIGSVQPGQTQQKTITVSGSLQVGFTVLSTDKGGEEMAGIFSTITSPAITERFTVDNVIGSQYYFAPYITNNSGSRLLVGVNMGLQAEKRTNRVAPANTSNVVFGYFRGYSNSNVRAYKEGSSYTGSYKYWDNLGITKGSGRINLTNTSNLRIATESPDSDRETVSATNTPTSNSYRLTRDAMEQVWNAPASFFIKAPPLK